MKGLIKNGISRVVNGLKDSVSRKDAKETRNGYV
jgi:hypothetical protein